MNVPFGDLDLNEMNVDLLNKMDYLHSYLENNWTIKKKGNCYILTHDKNKILVSDNIRFSKSLQIQTHKNRDDNEIDIKYILYFLHNVLNNGWTIRKTRYAEYTFIKNHEGKKEIFSDNYLHTFLKDNFNFKLIK